MKTVFIDGSAGTTGLRIHERLANRDDLQLLELPKDQYKDPEARREALNSADIAFLCLPDAAAEEAVSLVTSPDTVLIDTSTAHRTDSAWTYGFPELAGQRELIVCSKRIANPGCHASGFIALVAPLLAAGVLASEARLSAFSLTGYSGGGKKMIAEYEASDRSSLLLGARQYGLSQTHKHLPEMIALCGLEHAPVFCPIVAPCFAGMEVTVPLTPADTSATPEELAVVYQSYYTQGLIRYRADADENGFLSCASLAGRDDMEISVYGNAERMLLIARFDNLGKGACGAAIQNMNLVLGLPEDTGLVRSL